MIIAEVTMSWSCTGDRTPDLAARSSNSRRTIRRSRLCAAIASCSASVVIGSPVSRSSSVRNSPIMATTRAGPQESFIELFSIPKNTGVSGRIARITSAAPMS